ncbi:MAG TPA: EVE domain-containing protein [Gemmatimonadaceae bacterium]
MPAASRQHWLVKSEPDVFSFDDLMAAPKKTTFWNGVRNFAARNHLREMKKGDLVFFYHSMAKPPAVVGVAEVVREAYPDPTAFDPKDEYYDPKSKREDPTWFMVDIRAVEALPRPVPIDEIKKTKGLEKMALVRIGRLSVQPVSPKEWEIIEGLSREEGSGKREEGPKRGKRG